jgi:adenine-specific DNA-methyltransferase
MYHADRELSDDEVFGIAALLNSEVYDRYFRLMSGSTQVNATELRMLRFPPLIAIQTLGRRIRSSPSAHVLPLEDIVLEVLTAACRDPATLTESLT